MRVRRQSVEKWDKCPPGDPEVPSVDWCRSPRGAGPPPTKI